MNGDDRVARWLSINDACRFLGVDQSTLRRWSDEGKVPVFRTPGGHRRYAEEDLQALVGDRPRRKERSRAGREALTERSLSAYEDAYRRAARERQWFKTHSVTTLEEHRRLGHRLVDLAIHYAAAAPDGGNRDSLLSDGRQIGEQYGHIGASAGLSVVDTIEAFLYFRFPVVQAVVGVIEEEGLAARRAARLFVEVGDFMDKVLVATVHAHESDRARA